MQLPEQFKASIKNVFGEEIGSKMLSAIELNPIVSIRLNPDKLGLHNYEPAVASLHQVPWCNSGYYLSERPKFTFDPSFHQGAYYVQEASSMFLEQIIKQHIEGDVVALDLCAAPGGKSTLLRSLLTTDSLLISNEIVGKRAQILSENIQKWGHPNSIVTNNSSEAFTQLKNLFDVIVADVPCSGEGMFRKDDQAIEEWSLDNVAICETRQRDIITAIWPSLKPGGVLIYSTCTFNTAENEDNVDWMINEFGAEALKVNIQEDWGVEESVLGNEVPSYRFLPHKVKGEGLFMCALRKPLTIGESTDCKYLSRGNKKKKKDKKQDATFKACLTEVRNWILNSDNYDFNTIESFIYAFPTIYSPHLELLKSAKLHIIHAGIPLAEIKGKGLIPDQALACSLEINLNQFEAVEVCYEQAITYLRKEAVTLPATAPKGLVLLKYKSLPLGFVKNIGNRSNNLYPNEWRIRTSYVTKEIELVVL